MKTSEIETTFSTKQKLPQPIADICSFLESNGYPISGCFEISKIGMTDIKLWFKDDEDVQAMFMPFGRGACGDIYTIWLTEGLSPESAPIVMLGSEGQLEVLALDSLEFCRLLCLGYSEIGLDDSTQPPSDYEETKRFRDFVQEKYNFTLPDTAQPIIEKAKARFPNFQQWVADHQK